MSTPAHPHILLVGHCHVDGPRITRYIARRFSGTVDRADTQDQALALAAANHYDLVLINRLLDIDRGPGTAVITALRAAHPDVPTMLISDYPEAQQEAARLGALPGFGKAALDSPETETLLRSVLSGKTNASS